MPFNLFCRLPSALGRLQQRTAPPRFALRRQGKPVAFFAPAPRERAAQNGTERNSLTIASRTTEIVPNMATNIRLGP